MFQDTYGTMNRRLTPPAELVRTTLEQATSGRTIRPRRSFLRRTVLAGAVLAACLCAVPAAAAVWNPAYQMFYQISPAAAQFFQPVQTSCTDQDITMTVSAVRVEGDTAQAYITFSGGSVDDTTDLFDSWSFHLPFDQTGNCEQVHWDEETGTVTFLCTTQTMDGSPIPAGSKMTVSARQLLTGKETRKDTAVDIALEDYSGEAPTLTPPGGSADPFSRTGGSGEETLLETAPLLLPGEILAEPAEGLCITAAGYADGYFHIQLCRGNAAQTDNHARLWLEDPAGNKLDAAASVGFLSQGECRTDYTEFLFDVAPEDLSRYTLTGDFDTASDLTEGFWQVTFPLTQTPE